MERNKKAIERVTRLRMKYLENVRRSENSQRFDRRRESLFSDSEVSSSLQWLGMETQRASNSLAVE